ncbi:hypothetical protein [[Flexibacter] sp. ATCC 35208]|uniref:hypothetical protein n=1 Tax=[Flexibacter] sp. ATCC 35208 TaxID=1936242 RepID=UPI0015C31A50|nr:hypothetical protein [[Flexibacter] sp. ATCC 35208]
MSVKRRSGADLSFDTPRTAGITGQVWFTMAVCCSFGLARLYGNSNSGACSKH